MNPPYKKDLNAYLGNVMINVNPKFGGINHAADLVKTLCKILWQDTLILGA
jgi:hypothetical protein